MKKQNTQKTPTNKSCPDRKYYFSNKVASR